MARVETEFPFGRVNELEIQFRFAQGPMLELKGFREKLSLIKHRYTYFTKSVTTGKNKW